MEEFLLNTSSGVKLEVYLPAEPVKLTANEISTLRKIEHEGLIQRRKVHVSKPFSFKIGLARRRRVACQGEPIQAFLVVSIPKDQKYNGRNLREYAYFYSNLQVSLQILQVTTEAGGKESIRPVQSTTLLRSGTISGATIVEAGRGAEWCEVGTSDETHILPSGEVVYRVEAVMAMDRDMIGRQVCLRIQIAPPSFPVDESQFPMPGVYEDTDEAQWISQTMQALYMRASGSKATRPSYYMDVKLTIIDPLHVEASVFAVGERALISLVLRNERTDGSLLRIDSVLTSEGTLGKMVWEGGGEAGQQTFPLALKVGEDVSLVGSMQLDALSQATQPPKLLLWWGGDGISGADGSQSILKLIDLQDQMLAAGSPEEDQVRIHLMASGAAVLGQTLRLTMTVTNLGTNNRFLSVIFPDEERQRRNMEASRAQGGGSCSWKEGDSSSSEYWALLPLIGVADFGLVEPGKSSCRSFDALARVEGLAKLEGLTLVDRLTQEVLIPRSDWACLVAQPGARGQGDIAQQTSLDLDRSLGNSPVLQAEWGTPWVQDRSLSRIRSMRGELGESTFIDALSPY